RPLRHHLCGGTETHFGSCRRGVDRERPEQAIGKFAVALAREHLGGLLGREESFWRKFERPLKICERRTIVASEQVAERAVIDRVWPRRRQFARLREQLNRPVVVAGLSRRAPLLMQPLRLGRPGSFASANFPLHFVPYGAELLERQGAAVLILDHNVVRTATAAIGGGHDERN